MPKARPAIELDEPAPRGGLRRCDHPECIEIGEYRAPRDRDRLREYYWFCLAHVREYNASWDYFRGMSATEIEAYRRADVVGGRPSWPMGGRQRRPYFMGPDEIREALRRAFGEDEGEPEEARFWRHRTQAPPPQRAEIEALAVFELSGPVTMEQVKARYKELVKRHHPDANGGDKAAEDRLKVINQAYTTLKSQAAKLGA